MADAKKNAAFFIQVFGFKISHRKCIFTKAQNSPHFREKNPPKPCEQTLHPHPSTFKQAPLLSFYPERSNPNLFYPESSHPSLI